MLGLKHGQNLLVDYDPQWPTLFETERRVLEAALGDLACRIEHYGSTAVEGLKAKPILDILVGVRPLSNWQPCRLPLEHLGYDYAEGAGVPGHYIFGRGRDSNERTHLVHVVEFEGESWRFNLAFRDALRASRSLRDQYLKAKQDAVDLAPVGRSQYNDLKSTFFEMIRDGYMRTGRIPLHGASE